jgi:hypothetical protein
MFHLIKLAIYALIGYALYEFVQGVLDTDRPAPRFATEQSRPGRTAVRAGGRR